LRSTTTAQRDVRRALIVLLAADGVPSRQISERVGMHESHVAMWCQRFRAEGLGGLEDRPRPGGPPKYGHDEIVKIAALATTAKDPDDPEATWTYQALADELKDEVGISRSQLWRILDELDIKLHNVQGWLSRRDDPGFWERVQERSVGRISVDKRMPWLLC
jgi:transposase